MDSDKYAYFLAKFRAASDDEFQDAVARLCELAEEAAEAVRQVALERGLLLPPERRETEDANKELTAEELATYTELSRALWNSSISKHVQFMFGVHALIFSFAFLGPQGLRVGALWLVVFAVPLSWAASRIGRRYTRVVCADGDRSVQEKQKTLKRTAFLLWPALLLVSTMGVTLASALRSA